jgi:hypothetical protein
VRLDLPIVLRDALEFELDPDSRSFAHVAE